MAQVPEIIKEYDVLYAVRTGVTVLFQKSPVFDGGIETPVGFKLSPENPRDLVFSAGGKSAVIKDMKKDHLDAALNRGFVMVYEMVDEEVVRCTPCHLQS